jgi:hypothetical protein
MGGAYPIRSAAPDVVFTNPALVGNARGISLSVERYAGDATLTTFAASSTTNITFGVQILGFDDPAFPLIGDQSLALAIGTGSSRAGEIAGTIGYSRTVLGVRLGAAGKWIEHWGNAQSTGAPAVDVGVTATPLDFLAVGLTAQNIGDFSADEALRLPFRTQLSLATSSTELGPLDVSASGEAHTVRDGKIGGGLGAQLSYWPFNGLTFYARGGARMGTTTLRIIGLGSSAVIVKQGIPTAGAGLTYKRFRFEYALDTFRGASDAHRFQVNIN